MKNFGFITLFLAAFAPVVSARLSLLRLAQGDRKLRGPSSLPEASHDEQKAVMRELVSFWEDGAYVSISMSTPISPVEIPDYGFDFSMSMSMPSSPTLPEDISVWWDLDLSYSYSMPVEDEPKVVSTVEDSTTGDGTGDETAAENVGDEPVSEVPRGSSNLAAGLLVGLVVAAIAVLSAYYVRKHHRASSVASVMTPLSNSPSIS